MIRTVQWRNWEAAIAVQVGERGFGIACAAVSRVTDEGAWKDVLGRLIGVKKGSLGLVALHMVGKKSGARGGSSGEEESALWTSFLELVMLL